jgi:hypothetical protein
MIFAAKKNRLDINGPILKDGALSLNDISLNL